MQFDPNYLTNVTAALDRVTATQQRLSEELSSGVRVNSLSDDPLAAGEDVSLSAQIRQDDTFSQTASSTTSRLQITDSALSSVVTQLTSAISLATEANNGTLNSGNVKTIATQLVGIRDEVLSLANTSYLGQYIFAGSKGSTAPYSLDSSTTPATAVYQGDADTTYLTTPNGQSILLNLPGNQVFSAAGNDVLGTLNALVADFSSGTPSATALSDTTQLSSVLAYVSQQQALVGNSINRLQAAATYAQTESTQLESTQTNLLQTDVAAVSTQLSTAESQQTALVQLLATLGKGSLFDDL